MHRCKHCRDEITRDEHGEWMSDADDMCGTDLYRDHEPEEN